MNRVFRKNIMGLFSICRRKSVIPARLKILGQTFVPLHIIINDEDRCFHSVQFLDMFTLSCMIGLHKRCVYIIRIVKLFFYFYRSFRGIQEIITSWHRTCYVIKIEAVYTHLCMGVYCRDVIAPYNYSFHNIFEFYDIRHYRK